MNKILLIIIFASMSLNAVINRDAAWTGIPQNTIAQRLATKYDPQARINRYASGTRFTKVPFRPYGPDYAQDFFRQTPVQNDELAQSPEDFEKTYSTRRHDATNIAPEHIGID